MKARIRIDAGYDAPVTIELEGRISYEVMNIMVSAPSSYSMEPIPVMFKVWEGDRTIIVPLPHLISFEMDKD